MIVSQNMVAEAEIICKQSIPMLDMKYHLCVAQEQNVKIEVSPTSPSVPIFGQDACSEVQDSIMETPVIEFVPNVRSGSFAEIGPRVSMDDEHICIDDLAAHLGFVFKYPIPSAFYAVFDGHGGPEAAAFVKRNAMRHLLVANAGDCRAVLCRRGKAVEMSQDHRPSYLPERKRVEELGGFIDDGYLNGYLSVTRALGDWDFKFPLGIASPLIAEPDVQLVTLTEDDEFLIIGCDGIWDVISSQVAISLVRRGLRRHDDPQQCARELVKEALRLNTSDNLTVIVICLSTVQSIVEACSSPWRRRFKACNVSEEARN
ncbi:hypothetical protein PIB30_089033 [Stylosanthes scabra]|uniref:protein-serine/threonine phosphatase n=1 Tax=Stylosanthes scabra TaxID=79078 RepID=A0ABU6YSU3_9FABA|nr:hypothetical protein [Stylosanthes scabra]